MKDLTGYVRETVINGILSGEFPPGSKLIPERDFSESYAVSRITVRRAFAQLEESGIIVRKRPHGTYVADTFRAHNGNLESIGLITTLPHEFSGNFVECISRCCEKSDILLALGIPEPDTIDAQLKIAIRMASRGIKNLIVWGAEKSSSMQVFERLRILGVNIVFFDQVIPGSFADYVGLDNRAAIHALFTQALKRGKKRINFVNFSDLNIDSNIEREEAFDDELRTAGIPGNIYHISCSASGTARRKFANRILCETGSDGAIIGVNAPIIQKLFYDIPQGVELLCVDRADHLLEIGVTGYAQPIPEMAQCAVDMLKNQCKAGKKWRASCRRFSGKLILP